MNKDDITVKYHRHLDGSEPEGMVYFTREDVHKVMHDYLEALLREKGIL